MIMLARLPILFASGHVRVQEGLVAFWDMPRAQCLSRGTFLPASIASGFAPLGGLQSDLNATHCLDGVGVGVGAGLRSRAVRGDALRPAAMTSEQDITSLVPMLESARAFTVELWLTVDEPHIPAGESRPILAFADSAAAQRGVQRSECDGKSLLIAQQGGGLRIEVASALRGRRHSAHSWSCLFVEADPVESDEGAGEEASVFTSPSALYHLAVVTKVGEPIAVYVNGNRLPDVFAGAAYTMSMADHPIEPQYASWTLSHHLLVAPALAHVSLLQEPPPWAGKVLSVALYAAALNASQVGTNYAASIRDSAPLAFPSTAYCAEDSMVEIELVGSDPFDVRYGLAQAHRLPAILVSLPARGTLYLDGGGRSAVLAEELPLTPSRGLVWYAPPADAFSASNITSDAVASFMFKVNDGFHDSLPATVAIVVIPLNDPPRPASLAIDAYAGVLKRFSLSAPDSDSSPGNASLTALPRHGRLFRATLDGHPLGTPLTIGTTFELATTTLAYLYADDPPPPPPPSPTAANSPSLDGDSAGRTGGLRAGTSTAESRPPGAKVVALDNFTFGA